MTVTCFQAFECPPQVQPAPRQPSPPLGPEAGLPLPASPSPTRSSPPPPFGSATSHPPPPASPSVPPPSPAPPTPAPPPPPVPSFLAGLLPPPPAPTFISWETPPIGSSNVLLFYPPAKDVVPPMVILSGRPVVEVLQLEEYRDEGATALDDTDGPLGVSVHGLEMVSTREPTPDGSPGYSIKYTATDAAGNSAAAVREVIVRSRCATTETYCHEQGACSVAGKCFPAELAVLFGSNAAAPPQLPVMPPDSKPPILKLLGSCDLPHCHQWLTDEGENVYVHEVLLGETFVDPGVSAFDETDGDLSASVSLRFFPGRVNTNIPTREGEPYRITYSVVDASRNSAVEVHRAVAVTCPKGESLCRDDSEAAATCSISGICNLRWTSTASFLAGSNVVDPGGVKIALRGPEVVAVPRGSPYAACPPDSPPGLICDRGAEASSATDGNLSDQIEVCSEGFPSGQGYQFGSNGLLPCQIDTRAPGTYQIEFRVRDSGTPSSSASVVRTVVVEASGTDCGDLGGLCFLPGAEATVNTPPSLILIGEEFVEVKQGDTFDVCPPGRASLPSSPCEPGGIAMDSEQGDLTGSIVALPAGKDVLHCLQNNCNQYRFTAKGLLECGVDTSSPPGTVIEIHFAVFDRAGSWATATRTITIKDPCLPGEFLCDGECFPVDCKTRSKMAGSATSLDTTPPLVKLHAGEGSASEVYLDYAASLGWSVLPCAAGEAPDATGCGATASDREEGDISSRIQVAEITDCPGGAKCNSCSPSLLGAGPPWCLPGLYSYKYLAEDSQGNLSPPAFRSVCVGSSGSVKARMYLGLLHHGNDQGQALHVAKLLGDHASAENQVLRQAAVDAVPGCFSENAVQVAEAAVISLPEHGWVIDVTLSFAVSAPCGRIDRHCMGGLEGDARRTRRLLSGGGNIFSTPYSSLQDALYNSEWAVLNSLPGEIFVSPINGVNLTLVDKKVQSSRTSIATPEIDLVGGALISAVSTVEAARASMLFDVLVPMASAERAAYQSPLLNDGSDRDLGGFYHLKLLEQLAYQDAILSQKSLFEEALDVTTMSSAASSSRLASLSDSKLLAQSIAEREADAQARIEVAFTTFEFRSHLSGPCPCLEAFELHNDIQGTFRIVFSVKAVAVHEESGARGRRMMQKGGNDQSPSATTTSTWAGYPILPTRTAAGEVQALGSRLSLPRFVGPRAGANKLIGGVMLNVERAAKNISEACSQPEALRFKNLSKDCERLKLLQTEVSKDSTQEWLNRLAGGQIRPFGADPVFVKQSSLYRPDLKAKMGSFYNVTKGSEELLTPDLPSGWYPHATAGRESGFPLVLELATSRARAKDLWLAVADGGFLGEGAKDLQVELMTYNPLTDLLGFNTVAFRWTPQWIEATTRVFALIPSISWSANPQYFMASVLLAVFAAGYLLLALSRTRRTLSRFIEERQRRLLADFLRTKAFKKVSAASKSALSENKGAGVEMVGVILDLLLGGTFLAVSAAGAVLAGEVAGFKPRQDYTVHDAQRAAPARFFLLNRAEPLEGPGGNATSPGGAGRWELPIDSRGLWDFSSDLRDIGSIRTWDNLQHMLMAVGLLLALARLLHTWVFQARLSVAAISIVKAVPALASLMVTAAIVTAMLAAWGHLLLGGTFKPFATYQASVSFLAYVLACTDMAGGTGTQLNEGVNPRGLELLALDQWMAKCFYYSVIFLLPILITNFLITIMLVVWDSTKTRVGGDAPTLRQQLAQLIDTEPLRLATLDLRRFKDIRKRLSRLGRLSTAAVVIRHYATISEAQAPPSLVPKKAASSQKADLRSKQLALVQDLLIAAAKLSNAETGEKEALTLASGCSDPTCADGDANKPPKTTVYHCQASSIQCSPSNGNDGLSDEACAAAALCAVRLRPWLGEVMAILLKSHKEERNRRGTLEAVRRHVSNLREMRQQVDAMIVDFQDLQRMQSAMLLQETPHQPLEPSKAALRQRQPWEARSMSWGREADERNPTPELPEILPPGASHEQSHGYKASLYITSSESSSYSGSEGMRESLGEGFQDLPGLVTIEDSYKAEGQALPSSLLDVASEAGRGGQYDAPRQRSTIAGTGWFPRAYSHRGKEPARLGTAEPSARAVRLPVPLSFVPNPDEVWHRMSTPIEVVMASDDGLDVGDLEWKRPRSEGRVTTGEMILNRVTTRR